MCNCVNIQPQSKECYAQMIVVGAPAHMQEYAENRKTAGLSDVICLDPCILAEIKSLWLLGIKTYGSCCGHNKLEAFVNVCPTQSEEMIKLGYTFTSGMVGRIDTFKLRSV